jgi:hypothetical protein
VYTEGHILPKCGAEKVVSEVIATMFREGSYLHKERDAEDWVLLVSMPVSSEKQLGWAPGFRWGWVLNASVVPSWFRVIMDGRAITVAVPSSGYADSVFQL